MPDGRGDGPEGESAALSDAEGAGTETSFGGEESAAEDDEEDDAESGDGGGEEGEEGGEAVDDEVGGTLGAALEEAAAVGDDFSFAFSDEGTGAPLEEAAAVGEDFSFAFSDAGNGAAPNAAVEVSGLVVPGEKAGVGGVGGEAGGGAAGDGAAGGNGDRGSASGGPPNGCVVPDRGSCRRPSVDVPGEAAPTPEESGSLPLAGGVVPKSEGDAFGPLAGSGFASGKTLGTLLSERALSDFASVEGAVTLAAGDLALGWLAATGSTGSKPGTGMPDSVPRWCSLRIGSLRSGSLR